MKKCVICKVNPNYSFGMCRKHYEQSRKYGKAQDTSPRSMYDRNEIKIKNGIAYMSIYNKFSVEVAVTKIDIDSVDMVKKLKWHIDNYNYVGTVINGRKVKLHQLVMGRKKGCEIDHINHDTLDNRRYNLRHVTRSQNNMNRRGIKGVYFCSARKHWVARVYVNNRPIYLGGKKNYLEAMRLRKDGVAKYYGEYACKD
jgi:hypothetical protein